MRKLIGTVALTVLAAFLVAVSAIYAEELHIAVIDLPPYWFVEDGQGAGLAYEVGLALAEEAGLEPVVQPTWLERGLAELDQGRADLMILFPSPDVEAVGYNLGELFPMETVVIGRAGVEYRSPADLKDKRVAHLCGAGYVKLLEGPDGAILLPLKSYLQSLNMLIGGRVDAVLGPRVGLYYTIRANGLSLEAFGSPMVLSTVPATLYVSRKVPESMVERIRAALTSLIANGTMDAILAKYSK